MCRTSYEYGTYQQQSTTNYHDRPESSHTQGNVPHYKSIYDEGQFTDQHNGFLASEYGHFGPSDMMQHDSHAQDSTLSHLAPNPSFSTMLDDEDIAAALASYQPCDDCTPATQTTIPHHHHKAGRLAGASATLDGHFCCSWLVHDQPCFLCFESAEALDNHIKNDHAGKDGTYRCLWQSCSKQNNSTKTSGPMNFGNKPKLMRHVHSHTGFKPFPCPFPDCDKSFVTKEQLKNHETTHTKARKYKCDQCGKAFAVKSALTTHIMAVHEEKKTHRCEICGKAFADSSNLSKHKQTHLREGGIRKQRTKRGASIATSTRSTPSISTPSAEPATPIGLGQAWQGFSAPAISPGLMAPPALPKFPEANQFPTVTYSYIPTASTTSSPPPETFDPNCYCCEQRCPPPEGPPTPCDEADDCDLEGFCDLPGCSPTPCNEADDCNQDGFCDLPDCLEVPMPGPCNDSLTGAHQMEQLRNFQMPSQWDDMLGYEPQRAYSQREAEEQFTNMHGS